MAHPSAKMRSGPGSLFVASCAVALSLWMLNRDALEPFIRDFPLPLAQPTALLNDVANSAIHNRMNGSANRHLTSSQKRPSEAEPLALLLRWLGDWNVSPEQTAYHTIQAPPAELAARRRAAMALLIMAALERSQARGG